MDYNLPQDLFKLDDNALRTLLQSLLLNQEALEKRVKALETETE